jgi:hypothetical protein
VVGRGRTVRASKKFRNAVARGPSATETREHVGLGYHAGMSGATGGSAGSGHGSDPDEEALQRRIREFLRHGTAAEAGVEEWGEFAAQLRFLREELPLEERQALLERWDRVLTRALPDLQLAVDQRESALLALEAAAAEGAAWVALEDRMPLDQGAGVAPVLRPSVWTLDWEAPGGRDGDEDDGDHEDEMLVLKAADGRTEARFMLADRLVLAHLAADVRGLLAEGQSLPPIPDAEPPTSLPTLRVDAEAGFACTGFSIRGLPAIGLQVSRNDPPLAFLVLDADQLADLLGRARELLGTSA